jgi:hypothetical protein
MNKEQQELLDEAYDNYTKSLIDSITFSKREKYFKSNGLEFNSGYPNYTHYTQEEFIDKCKTNIEFSEKCGLQIKEQELSTGERNEWFQIHRNGNNPLMKSDWKDFELDQQNIPAKLITITHKNKTITSYE